MLRAVSHSSCCQHTETQHYIIVRHTTWDKCVLLTSLHSQTLGLYFMKHICFKIHIIPLQKRQMLSTLTWSWFMLYALVYSIAYAYACSWRRWCIQTRWDIWQSIFGLNIFMSSYICGLEAQVFTPQWCVCVCLSRRANLTDGPSVWFCQTERWKGTWRWSCVCFHI